MRASLKEVTLVRMGPGRSAADVDRAAVEEPLQIRLHDVPLR